MQTFTRALHGKGNLFFMCLCKLVGDGDIVVQQEELAAAAWMPIDEVMALPYYGAGTAYSELMRASTSAARSATDGLQRLRLPVGHDPKRGDHTIHTPRCRL